MVVEDGETFVDCVWAAQRATGGEGCERCLGDVLYVLSKPPSVASTVGYHSV